MKYLRSILLFLGLSVLLGGCNAQEAKPIHDINGKTVNIKAPGKWLIINYWASWCDSCQHEIPELNQFAKAHPEVLLYGYEFDHMTADQLKTVTKKMGIEYPQLLDDPTKALGLSADAVQGLPMTFVIDKNGKLVQTLPGPQTQEDLEQAISRTDKA